MPKENGKSVIVSVANSKFTFFFSKSTLLSIKFIMTLFIKYKDNSRNIIVKNDIPFSHVKKIK